MGIPPMLQTLSSSFTFGIQTEKLIEDGEQKSNTERSQLLPRLRRSSYALSHRRKPEHPVKRCGLVQDIKLSSRWSFLHSFIHPGSKSADTAEHDVISISLKQQPIQNQMMPQPLNDCELGDMCRRRGLEKATLVKWINEGVRCWMAFEFKQRDFLATELKSDYEVEEQRNSLVNEMLSRQTTNSLEGQKSIEKESSDEFLSQGEFSLKSKQPQFHSGIRDNKSKQELQAIDTIDTRQDIRTRGEVQLNTELRNSSENASCSETRKIKPGNQFLRCKTYRTSKANPSGARRWDEWGVCWVSRRYRLKLNCLIGSFLLSRDSEEKESYRFERSKSRNLLLSPVANVKALCIRDIIEISFYCKLDSCSKEVLGGLGCIALALNFRIQGDTRQQRRGLHGFRHHINRQVCRRKDKHSSMVKEKSNVTFKSSDKSCEPEPPRASQLNSLRCLPLFLGANGVSSDNIYSKKGATFENQHPHESGSFKLASEVFKTFGKGRLNVVIIRSNSVFGCLIAVFDNRDDSDEFLKLVKLLRECWNEKDAH